MMHTIQCGLFIYLILFCFCSYTLSYKKVDELFGGMVKKVNTYERLQEIKIKQVFFTKYWGFVVLMVFYLSLTVYVHITYNAYSQLRL